MRFSSPIYAVRIEVHAIVHAHSPFATSLACLRRAVAALDGRNACLLAYHGMVAVGSSFDAALALPVKVETFAETYWRVLQIGEPALLSLEE